MLFLLLMSPAPLSVEAVCNSKAACEGAGWDVVGVVAWDVWRGSWRMWDEGRGRRRVSRASERLSERQRALPEPSREELTTVGGTREWLKTGGKMSRRKKEANGNNWEKPKAGEGLTHRDTVRRQCGWALATLWLRLRRPRPAVVGLPAGARTLAHCIGTYRWNGEAQPVQMLRRGLEDSCLARDIPRKTRLPAPTHCSVSYEFSLWCLCPTDSASCSMSTLC
jgi:hypothetical protein